MADLKAFRKANKLTQEQVADYLGIKKPFICKIETGRELFPEKHLRKLLDNPHGWDVAHLVGVSETYTETNNSTDTPDTAEDVVVISTQVLEEMTAQRQLAEQALALVQEQLEAKQETIRITQEQLSTSQEQLSAEQTRTNNALASLAKSIERIDKAQAQMDELILMLKKEQSLQDQHLAKLEQERRDQAHQKHEQSHPQSSISKKLQDS